MADHPNKAIRQALAYAEANGWTVTKAGPRAHAWGIMKCSHGHRDCRISIYSTPKNPESHAKRIRRLVDRCPGPSEA